LVGQHDIPVDAYLGHDAVLAGTQVLGASKGQSVDVHHSWINRSSLFEVKQQVFEA
jgi:hypothetical protein